MEKIRILCYGDSNTWGQIPGVEHSRYDNQTRWTALLQNMLGKNFEVISEGLCARTLDSDDERWVYGNANGLKYFGPAVYSHDPLDFIIIMLGTNELKDMFERSAENIVKSMEDKYLKYFNSELSKALIKQPKIIIIAPPIVKGELYNGCSSFLLANEKSQKFNTLYKKLAKKHKCLFIDNGGLDVGCDGLHLSEIGHKNLAEKVYDCISNQLNI